METRRRRRKPADEQNDLVNQVKESAKKGLQPRKVETDTLIPSGSTLLNCCCSDNPFGAYPTGKIITVPGPSQTGKSILQLCALAEINLLPRFDEYDLIFDDGEEALEFDLSYLFGSLADRIKSPKYDGDIPINSNTIQDVQDNFTNLFKRKNPKPFIYVMDSLDSLTSEEEMEREYANAIVRAKSDYQMKELQQSYNTEKARIIGRILRMIKGKLRSTRSLLIMIQQERMRLNAPAFAKQYTTSGGKAPFYYSTHQIRMTKTGTIKPGTIEIGHNIQATVVKNKLTGKTRTCAFNIYEDLGVDDVASCVEFLCKEHWKHPKEKGKEKTGTWIAEELGFQGTKATLINKIEEDNLENEMRKIVGLVWNDKEASLRLNRKRRF